MNDFMLPTSIETDPFGLRKVDFRMRVPEQSEMFSVDEARAYIEGCDYPESADDFMLALEIEGLFGQEAFPRMKILDVMAGPGRLGRELSQMGAGFVLSHDGDPIMIAHAAEKASSLNGRMGLIRSPVEAIPLPDNSFDLVVCHNATHQLTNQERLQEALTEFVRLTVPGGYVVIADFQRGTSPQFIAALEERLRWTKQSIVPLLLPTFRAAFSKDEFSEVLSSIPGIAAWSVTDAHAPTNIMDGAWARIQADPVKGHLLDFSPISLRAIAQKEES